MKEDEIPFDVRMTDYNRETVEAFKEAKEIMSGKGKAKSYRAVRELFDELDAE